MFRLIRRRGQERGAVAVVVAIVFGSLVVSGAAALTIDAGSLYSERRVVQNGADAASLALAQACARGDVARCSATSGDLTSLANLNSPDRFTDIDSVCGSTAPFASCGALPANPTLVQCTKLPPSFPATVKWVEVRTKTRSTTANPSVVRKYFANLSDPSYDGIGVKACARAAWGPGYPADEVVAVTDALCAWTAATSNTPPFPPLPPYSASPNDTPLRPVPVDDKYVVKVLLQGAPRSSTDPATCGKNDTSSGQYIAGNFGWLNVKAGTACTANIDQDTGVVGGSTGGSPPAACDAYLESKVGSIIYLPIFTKVTGTGSGTEYTIDGVSAFFLAGFQAPSATKIRNAYDPGGNTSPTPHCIVRKKDGVDKDNGCLWGWFLSPKLPVGTIGGGTARGPSVVSVAG